MVIREIDDELEKEVNGIETYLLVSFETEKDTLLAIGDIKKKYECIAYHTLESDTCNVIIPASKNGTQLFEYEFAKDYGETLCRKYRGTGFVTLFKDIDWGTGELIGWLDFYYYDGERVISGYQ